MKIKIIKIASILAVMSLFVSVPSTAYAGDCSGLKVLSHKWIVNCFTSRFLVFSRFVHFREPTSSRFSRSPYKGNETSPKKASLIVFCSSPPHALYVPVQPAQPLLLWPAVYC